MKRPTSKPEGESFQTTKTDPFYSFLLGCMFCTVSKIQVKGSALIGGMGGEIGGLFGRILRYLKSSCISAIVTVGLAWVVTLILPGTQTTVAHE